MATRLIGNNHAPKTTSRMVVRTWSCFRGLDCGRGKRWIFPGRVRLDLPLMGHHSFFLSLRHGSRLEVFVPFLDYFIEEADTSQEGSIAT
ncbi:hypothetical protein BAE44_0008823 [Dichanthelium oligosanthes]|uniref:Uncharacterized protein n=1 Tax=Dichanthelium oligosanthes TaxID=888268 RepID=A0A1E5VYI9_9POAL|nr:hypothetical protein BAE44_0008823 [Dichanthelium oligosanthes]